MGKIREELSQLNQCRHEATVQYAQPQFVQQPHQAPTLVTQPPSTQAPQQPPQQPQQSQQVQGQQNKQF